MTLDILHIYGTGDANTLETNFFEQATRYIYGLEITNTPSETSIKEANRLWNTFLSKTGKTNADIENDLYTDPINHTGLKTQALNDYKALYTEFLLERLGQASLSNAVNLLSPDEIEARNILFRTFELVLKMLSTLQKNLILVTNAYALYTKWQNEYIQMMAHTPIYTLDPPTYATGNINDIGKAEISNYSSITVGDVLKYTVENMIKNKSTSESWGSRPAQYVWPWPNNDFELKKGTDSEGNYIEFAYTLRGNDTAGQWTSWEIFRTKVHNISTDDELRNSMTTLLQQATAIVKATCAAQGWWGSLINRWATGQGQNLENIATTAAFWNPNIVSTSTKNASDTSATGIKDRLDEDKARAQTRGERNSQLQVYLDNARSRKAMVQSSSKPVEDLMTQCRESLQAQANLANTICDTLKGIISAIYRV